MVDSLWINEHVFEFSKSILKMKLVLKMIVKLYLGLCRLAPQHEDDPLATVIDTLDDFIRKPVIVYRK